MSLGTVYSTVQTALAAAINQGGITAPGQVIIGWPVATELVRITGQTNQEWLCSIYQMTSKKATRYIEDATKASIPNTGLTATLSGGQITFAGTTLTATNVHTFLLGRLKDAYVSAPAGTPASGVAFAVAAAITALALPGISATASGAQVTVLGAQIDDVNIGGSGQTLREVARVEAILRITIWCTGPSDLTSIPIGDAIADAIKQRVGTVGTHNYVLPDSSTLYLDFINDEVSDASQSSYSLYEYRLNYMAEYGTIAVTPATQVGGISATGQLNANPPSTIAFGGYD